MREFGAWPPLRDLAQKRPTARAAVCWWDFRALPLFFPLFRFGSLSIELTGGCFSDGLCRAAPSARPLKRTVDQNRQQKHRTYDLHDREQRHRLDGLEHALFSVVGATAGRADNRLPELLLRTPPGGSGKPVPAPYLPVRTARSSSGITARIHSRAKLRSFSRSSGVSACSANLTQSRANSSNSFANLADMFASKQLPLSTVIMRFTARSSVVNAGAGGPLLIDSAAPATFRFGPDPGGSERKHLWDRSYKQCRPRSSSEPGIVHSLMGGGPTRRSPASWPRSSMAGRAG
jgi:hypothetical protein